MKKALSLILFAAIFAGTTTFAQQDKSKRASPPAKVSETLKSGAVITIEYSQPSLKGRDILTLAPFGKVWRTGANEATTFETSKDVTVEGKALPAGKYSLYTIPGEKEWTIIFNKTWNQWGTIYKQEMDQLRVTVKADNDESMKEKLTFSIDKDGEVSIAWGKTEVEFKVK